MTKPQQTKRRHPGIILIILLAVFVIPVVIAWMLYRQDEDPDAKTTNYGHLIVPPFTVKKFNLATEEQQQLRGHWVMILFYPTPCQQTCQKSLYDLRQIRTAMGKDRNRVERAIITYRHSKTDDDMPQWLEKYFSGTYHLQVKQQRWKTVTDKYVHVPDASKVGAIYLADPRGNVMMVYQPNADPNDIYKDVKQLLRVSQIG